MNRNLVRILADMVEATLDRRNASAYASQHEEEVSDLREEVLSDNDVDEVLFPRMQAKGSSPTTARGKGG